MDIDIIKFVSELTIIQMVVFLVAVELVEVLTGILRAWKEGKPIQSAITRKGIYDKFVQWIFPFMFVMFSIWANQEPIAKMILTFISIPELTSVVENIVRFFSADIVKKSYNDEV